jgi:hypothetical protein
MCKLRALPAFLIVGALLFGCGDLDLALSSGKAYKVNALINGLSLDQCAVLSRESRISPYFDFNVKGDPDIASLVIYIKDYMGKETGFRVQYNFLTQDTENTEETDTASIADTEDDGVQDTVSGEDADDDTIPTMGAGTASTTDDNISTDDATVPADSGTLSVIESGTESVTETENVNITENPPEPFEKIISVKNLGDELPEITLGPDMALGFYSIVFEVIALNGTLLNSVEKPFFYLAGKEFAIKGITSYIPGVSSSSSIVPAGEKIMLQVDIDADPDIEPYVIWYNGKHQIGEGFAHDGAYRIFWNAPAQNVFQDIRVEVFPFDPTRDISTIRGISHTVSLSVSNRHDRNGYYADMEVQMSRWYRLWGNLADTKDPVSISALLARMDDREPLWFPVFSTYGLALGANDLYKLPDSLFKYVKQGEGSAEIVFRLVPVDNTAVEKPVFRADLQGKDGEGNESVCVIQLSLFENTLLLQASRNDEILEIRPSLPLDGLDFVPAAIDFQFFEDRIVVSMGIENVETNSIDTWERLTVDFVPNGEGSVWFGGFLKTEEPADSEAVATNEKPADSVSAVITEIALLYNEISPALEPVQDEESEEEILTESTEEQRQEPSSEELFDDEQLVIRDEQLTISN